MALGVVQPSEVESLVATFEETGYIVLPLLTPGEVTALRRAFAEDRAASGHLWTLRGTDARGGPTGESGRWQSGDVLRTSTSAFASVVAHPRILQLVAALIGPAARYSSCSAMWREPVLASPPDSVPEAYQSKNIHWQLWHREAGGTTSPDHPRCIPTLQVIVYLDDCDESSHCFSVVPESVEDKLRLPTEVIDGRMRVVPSSLTGADDMWTNRPLQGRPGWENRATGTDIHAPAGTVVIQVRSHANGNSHTPPSCCVSLCAALCVAARTEQPEFARWDGSAVVSPTAYCAHGLRQHRRPMGDAQRWRGGDYRDAGREAAEWRCCGR
jgi:hypothetical protein